MVHNTVLLDKDQLTIRFSDGSVIGSEYCTFTQGISRWVALIYTCLQKIVPGKREEIIHSRIYTSSFALELCYAYS